MKVLHVRCAGLDVHKELVVACVRLQGGAKVQREQRRCDTTTKGLLELLAWLTELECTHVAMEATGVYWEPVGHVLEGHVELVLANAAHIRNVPGRKSDMNDATWIADLLVHGLITASMIPPTPIQELRDLTRTRRQLVREIGQHTQRVQRVLEDANVKLSSVISNIVGLSGRRILDAIVAGEEDPEKLAARGSERLQCAPEQLGEALRGRVTAHHRLLLRQHLDTIDHLQGVVGAARTKRTYTQAQFLRLTARREPMKAVVAVAATILTAAFYILRDGVSYRDLGPDHFVERDRTRVAERLARRIRELGYEVTIKQAA